MKTLVLLFLISVANAAEVKEDSDPIVILDGKPVRKSQLSNPVQSQPVSTKPPEKPKCVT